MTSLSVLRQRQSLPASLIGGVDVTHRCDNRRMSHQLFDLHPRPSLPVLIQPQSSIALSGLRVLLDQRGWPRATIMEGPAHDDGNRLALYITAEFEEPSELPLSKRGTEWLHLAKAHHDLQRGQDASLAGSPRFGNDPPDFQLAQHSEVVSVELAQFTQSHRRRALGLLRGVKQAIIDAPRAHFEHLRHRLVLLGFADPRGLPPRSKDRSAIQTILDTLRSTDPGPAPATLPETINPHGFHVSLKNSPLGNGESACFPLPLLPQSELAQTCGFEIAASLTVIIRAGDTEWNLPSSPLIMTILAMTFS